MPEFHCDFCNRTLPEADLWTYPARSFGGTMRGYDNDLREVAAAPWGSEGDWAACDDCHALIEAGKWHLLACRVIDSPYSLVPQPRAHRDQAIFVMEQMHKAFREHRTGDPYKGTRPTGQKEAMT